MKRQQSLFENHRQTLSDSLELTAQSINVYAENYNHWAIAYSGGKDSSALLTAVLWLIQQGKIKEPESLTVLYSDTRQEIIPLHIGALETLKQVQRMGYKSQIVLPDIDDRYFVYILGRGVPPPSNTFRWCTPKIKVLPMVNALKSLRDNHGEKFLMLTGVRVGESAVRDQRIALSCGKNGTECGQGWFQESTPEAVADTLAPILHWRVCHVWDWLMFGEAAEIMPSVSFVAQAYGGEEAEEINARTGCMGCPLASRDKALSYVVSIPEWAYLAPLLELRELYTELRSFQHRKQKNAERNADGNLSSKPCRKGPLTPEARLMGLERVLEIQGDVNTNAILQGRPRIELINGYEEHRIRQLISERVYPMRWSDDDPDATTLIQQTYANGDVQQILPLYENQ